MEWQPHNPHEMIASKDWQPLTKWQPQRIHSLKGLAATVARKLQGVGSHIWIVSHILIDSYSGLVATMNCTQG